MLFRELAKQDKQLSNRKVHLITGEKKVRWCIDVIKGGQKEVEGEGACLSKLCLLDLSAKTPQSFKYTHKSMRLRRK